MFIRADLCSIPVANQRDPARQTSYQPESIQQAEALGQPLRNS